MDDGQSKAMPFPCPGWWRDLRINKEGNLWAMLMQFRHADYDRADVIFTHDVLLRAIELTPDQRYAADCGQFGPPALYLPRSVYPLNRRITLFRPIVVGQAGAVEQFGVNTLAFISLGWSHAPVYCIVPEQFELRLKC
jgi:hypothetical protein